MDNTQHKLATVTWHLKLDIALVVFALWLGVYMEAIFGALGLGQAARASANLGSRFAAWQSITRGTLLSLDDAAQVAKAVLGKDEGEEVQSNKNSGNPWLQTWLFGDYFSIAMLLIFAILIALAPALTEHSAAQVFAIIQQDLRPFP